MFFYELITGQHPFKADTMIGLLHSITSQSPLPPSRLNPEIPYALDALISRMLEKDAGLRPAAREVDQALQATGGWGDRATGRIGEAAFISPRLPVAPSPSRKTVGRERERAELRSGFASALAGRGLMMCVAGEPGIGKTTLVEDFLAELAAEGHCAIARVGVSLQHLGELVLSEEHFAQGLELYYPSQSLQTYTLHAEPGIGCYGMSPEDSGCLVILTKLLRGCGERSLLLVRNYTLEASGTR